MITAPVNPGELLAGKYLVDRVLGQGGMGVVVAARHVELDEQVAIKFLLPELASQPEVVARFLREGKAAVKIRSEHVVRVSDVGRLENGAPYMVMEYLEGCDLGELVRRRGPLPSEEAVVYLLQACEALAEAHAHGIVHRDLKPQNLFLTHRADGSPCVKVLDFGIAKFTRQGDMEALTKTTGMLGSALYMSPEQLRAAKDVDARTDVWAIGVVLFEMLTGNKPFVAEAFPLLVAQILEGAPIQLRALRPDAPAALEAFIDRCLQKRREDRFDSVATLALSLLPFAGAAGQSSVDRITKILSVERSGAPPVGSAPVSSIRLSPLAATADVSAQRTDGPWGRTGAAPSATDKSRSIGGVVALAAALAVASIAVGAVLLIREDEDSRPVPSSASSPASVTATPIVSVATASAAPSASEAAPAALSVSTAHAKPSVTKPAPPPIPVKKPPSAPNCDPPTYVGEDGLQHFKPECK